ncbi:MAG: hypothetical protein ABI361_04955 [Nitrososphaera sp.]
MPATKRGKKTKSKVRPAKSKRTTAKKSSSRKTTGLRAGTAKRSARRPARGSPSASLTAEPTRINETSPVLNATEAVAEAPSAVQQEAAAQTTN